MDILFFFNGFAFYFTCLYHSICKEALFNIKYTYLLRGYVYNFTISQTQIILIIKVTSDGEDALICFVFFFSIYMNPLPPLA